MINGCVPACRACSHRDLSADESAAQKSGWLRHALSPWADRLAPMQSVPDAERRGYRDRVSLAADWNGGWRFGTVVRDEVVPIPDCPVHSPRVRRVVRSLATILPPPERFPLVRYVQQGGQGTLILKSSRMPDLDRLMPATEAMAAAGLEGLWLHLFPAVGRHTFHKRNWRLLWGQSRSRDSLGLVHGPTAFQQLIPDLYEAALDTAEAHLDAQRGDMVADLYCGNGASLRRWTARGARALGVEVGGEAVACATVNAPEARVLRGRCEHRLPQLTAAAEPFGTERRLLYLNPPRTGLETRTLKWITNRYRPVRAAYLSCNAGTLRRDLATLQEGGFAVDRIVPYDFFPQTRHVETLALVRRGPSA